MARWLAIVVLASCGRLGFDARTGDAGDSTHDGSPDAATIGFTHLVAYGDQTCAIWQQAAYCWGDNSSGQLGIADAAITAAFVPTPVNVPAGMVNDLTEGASHGCVIVNHTLYCYGASFTAQAAIALPAAAAKVGAGNGFTCAVANAKTYCWGANAGAGQLAVGDMNPRLAPTPTLLVATTEISIGDDHGCALENGSAMCWGHNDDGALGFGSMNPQNNPMPQNVVGAPNALPRIAGWHSCDLVAGVVRCWGEGDNGEIGDGLVTNTANPTAVPGAAGASAIGVGGGPADLDASCAVIGGAVKCWGNGTSGRLGQGSTNKSAVPIPVVGLPGAAIAVALGYAHSCALLADGDIWCWGRGASGQLGDGKGMDSLAPVRVLAP